MLNKLQLDRIWALQVSEKPLNPYILVVDDEWRLAANIVRFLERRGWDARAVRSVESAYRAIDERPPDFAIVDLRLPDCSGIDLCRTISRRFPSLPVVVMSARIAPEEHEPLTSIGVLEILTKPFPLSELAYLIDGSLDLYPGSENPTAVMVDQLIQAGIFGIGGTG